MNFLFYAIEKGGNLGSILRTSASFGIKEIFLHDKYSILEDKEEIRRAKDTSMGHFDEVLIKKVDELDIFLSKFENIFATTVGKNSKRIGDDKYDLKIPKDSLIIFGNETRGLPRKISGAKGVNKIIIPTRGMEHCLSLPVAFAITAYEFLRQNQELFPHRGR